MSRIHAAAAAMLLTVSGSTFAAGSLQLPVLGQALGNGNIPLLGALLSPLDAGLAPVVGALPGLLNPVLGALPALPALPSVPQPVVVLLGTVTSAAGPLAAPLPVVPLVEVADGIVRPLVTPLNAIVPIPVVGPIFGGQ